MSLSDDALLATQALQRLRGLRADRADRLLHKALLEQRGLNLRIEQARTAVEQARLHESRQRAALLNRYRGRPYPGKCCRAGMRPCARARRTRRSK